MLSERFEDLLIKIKNPMLKHPVFYNCPIAIRFEIGCKTPVYLDTLPSGDIIINPEYIEEAQRRAKAIYTSFLQAPNLLRIDSYSNENRLEYKREFDLSIFQELISFPQEQRQVQIKDGNEQHTILQLYWDLCKIDFLPDLLLKEIIKADLGGISALASNVYFANTEEVYLYHIYDDRGADLAAECQETLYPIYKKFNQWILEYNRKEIDELFIK